MLKSISFMDIQQYPELDLEYFMENNDSVKLSIKKRKNKSCLTNYHSS